MDTSVNRALYDAEMIAFSNITNWEDWTRKERAIGEIAALFEDEEFDDAIRRATGDKARLRLRIERVVGALREAGAEVETPDFWQ